MTKIIKIILLDILKNKIIIAYTLLLSILSWSSFLLEDSAAKGILTCLNVILFTVPLFTMLFSTIYLYNSAEFILLLVSQPIQRSKIWICIYISLSIALITSFFLGAGMPLLLYATIDISLNMLANGFFITLIFTSLAFLSAVYIKDKAKGIGSCILIWLFFSLLFDGLVLFLLFQFQDYPIEMAMVSISALNPIDLARIQILLYLDVSAMMGYTGAIFKNFFGTHLGYLITFFILSLWSVIPFFLSLKKFKKNDL